MSNPARLDYAVPGDSRTMVWVKRLAVALAFYPLLLLLAVYGGWLLAWAHMGHRPRPFIDDPRFGDAVLVATAAPVVTVYFAAGPVLLLHWALVAAVSFRPSTPDNPLARKVAIAGGAILLWAVAFLLLTADPGGVVRWWGVRS
jgi:hypothetical protein